MTAQTVQGQSSPASQSTAASPTRSGTYAAIYVTLIVLGTLAAIVALSVFAIVFSIQSSVSGAEFDPVSWTIRDFEFRQNPWTQKQMGSISQSTRTTTIDPAILKLINGGPFAPSVQRWDLVDISVGTKSEQGPASVLLKYLDASNPSGNGYWTEWTTANPSAAVHLWSAVRDAVHLDRYHWLPQLFDLAESAKDAQSLDKSLSEFMASQALKEAKESEQLGNASETLRLASAGLKYVEKDELKQLMKKHQASKDSQ